MGNGSGDLEESFRQLGLPGCRLVHGNNDSYDARHPWIEPCREISRNVELRQFMGITLP